MALAGAAGVFLGCLVPYAQACDVFCNVHQYPSLFDDQFHKVSWFAAEPLVAIGACVMGAPMLLLARRPVDQAVLGGLLAASGLATFALFIGFVGTYLSSGRGGPIVGAAGAMLVCLGGVAAATAALRSQARHENP